MQIKAAEKEIKMSEKLSRKKGSTCTMIDTNQIEIKVG